LRHKPVATLQIRANRFASAGPDAISTFEPAVQQASAQTPEGVTREVAFVLAWLQGGTFAGRVALERDRYAGLRAELLALTDVPSTPRDDRERVELALSVRARASMAEVHQLLAGTQTRIAALLARTSAAARR